MSCIAIDCRFASVHAGLGTYTRGIVPPLVSTLSDHHIALFVRDESEEWLRELPDSVTLCTVDAPHYSVAEQALLPKCLRQLSVDLLYSPHFNVPLACPVPFVATVHDLILHRYPNSAGFVKRVGYNIIMKHAVTKAAHVITVSSYTTDEVLRTYGVTATHITEGVSPSFTKLPKVDADAILSDYGLLSDYFLYVGGSNEHKNLQMLIDAYADTESDAPLVLVSGGKGLRKLRLRDNVSILTNVPHRDVPALYNGARCFVTASLYEGFCLPILEARACGTPVIATNVTAIPEVAGPHALLVDPTKESLAAAIKNPPTKADPVEKTYNWESAASDVSAILRDTLHG